jgi:hypothetical protein
MSSEKYRQISFDSDSPGGSTESQLQSFRAVPLPKQLFYFSNWGVLNDKMH